MATWRVLVSNHRCVSGPAVHVDRFVVETCAELHTCPACLVQTVHMVSNLPHITVRLPGTDVGTGKREALLMVDLGASGIDIIFHSKAVKELGLQDLPKPGPSSSRCAASVAETPLHSLHGRTFSGASFRGNILSIPGVWWRVPCHSMDQAERQQDCGICGVSGFLACLQTGR